jgi:urease subunit alpha
VKPALVLQGGMIAMAPMGDPNASIPTPQPVHYRPMFGAFGRARALSSVTFISLAAIQNDLSHSLGVEKMLLPVSGTRSISKASMIHNNATPNVEVDAETYEVRVDGTIITCEPAAILPLAQRYFLY